MTPEGFLFAFLAFIILICIIVVITVASTISSTVAAVVDDEDNVMDIIHTEIGKVFSEVLEDAGVYKRTEEGQKAFMKFVDSLK